MGFNAKLFEVVVYPESFDMSSLDGIFENNAIKDYAYIVHDMDDKKAHAHIAIRTIDTRNSDNVAKWFGVLDNAVGRVKGRWSDILKYLTHRNSTDKHQYDDDLVKSNFDWKKAIEKSEENTRLNDIIENIANGNIREYNYTNHITDKEYIRYKQKIVDAFNYRKDKLRGSKREMENVYIVGQSGSGKTTYAKMICEEKNYSYFVSSGSNDVLDGYMGEDVIILDDLRPSCMGLSDLLKMLDNNTASTVKSRYKNKTLECKMIIITTVLPIETFFNNVFSEEHEPIIQLKRRCKTYIDMSHDNMNIYMYDSEVRDYDVIGTFKNPVSAMFKYNKLNKEEKIEKAKRLLTNLVMEDNNGFYEVNEVEGKKMSIFDEQK